MMWLPLMLLWSCLRSALAKLVLTFPWDSLEACPWQIRMHVMLR